MNLVSKFYQRLVSIGITDELSFSEKLRVELNNLFLGIALPCLIIHLVYITLGPRVIMSYMITFTWVIILVVPLYLNYRRKYFAAKLYTILIPVIGVAIVHILHGWGMRMEPAYLMMILMCSFFFKKSLAVIMSCLVAMIYILAAVLLTYIEPPLAQNILPTVPFAYLVFSIVTSIVLIRKVLVENENFNLITTAQNDSLAKKNKQLEKFTYIASHDLKTPIRNVTSFASLIGRDLAKEKHEDIPEHLEYIKSSALQMSALVEDILQISTLDYADHEVRDMTSLDETIEKVLLTLQNELSASNAVVHYESLPDYYCNPSEFYLIFQNLIQNGVKYNKSEVPSVKIWYTQTAKTLQIHLEDNGIGIEEAYHEHIFEFFKRLHPSSEYEGTGLGLGLCKRIIESYQGSISLQSSLDQGSVFTVHLPLNIKA